MKLQLFGREHATPSKRFTSMRDLSIGTGAPKALGSFAGEIAKMGIEVANNVRNAEQTMEYSNAMSESKVRMAEFYEQRSQDVENHGTLIDDTNNHFKDISAELTDGIKDIAQRTRIKQGLNQVRVSYHGQATKDANGQSILKIKADQVRLRAIKIQEASVGTDEEIAPILANYSLEMRNLAKTGVINPVNAENDIISFIQESVTGKTQHLINNDPWQAKEYLEDGEALTRLLEPVRREQYLSQAQTQINIRENRAKSQANAESKAIEKANKVEVAATVKQLSKGVVPDNYDNLLETVNGTELAPKLVAAHKVADDVAKFNTYSPVEKQAAVEALKAKGRKTGVIAARIDALEKNLYHTRNELSKGNGLGLASEQGVIGQLPPLAYDVPELLQERKFMAQMASEHYGQDVSPITESEAELLVGELDSMFTTDRVTRLGTMVAAWGEQALPAFEQIANKKGGVYAITGALISEGRNETAIGVMAGLDTMKANPKIIPRDFIYEYDALVGDAYADNPAQSVYIREATQALYAQLSVKQGRTIGEESEVDDMETALNAVTGGIYELDIETFGWNDTYKLESPGHDVEQDDFEVWLEEISGADLVEFGGTANNEEVARRISEGRIKLISLGSGNYGVQLPDGRPVVAIDGTGLVLRYPVK